MPIVSISLTDADLETLDNLLSKGGYSNRSDLVRRALRLLALEVVDLEQFEGDISAVITIVYSKQGKGMESNFLLHRQARLINALLHSHTVNGECIEVMVLNGSARDIQRLVKRLEGNRKIHTVKLALIGGVM
ncbi:MAG: CopG family ribbon-helix-helix protein [Candidatus Hermodarchaeota archaeon]|jgi:CopG family nickel-responsive transcriptional regulator|nr:CopG family ribbon-helix-helix protein [Candidatus Hermodarchaeota archaeon]